MNIELSAPQAEAYMSTAKQTAVVSGFGAGKTEFAMFRLISTALKFPEADFLYCAPTIPLIRDILWAKLDDFLPKIGLKHSLNKSESIVYLKGFGKIFCRSMDNPERLVGFEVLDAFLDEMDILSTEKAISMFMKVKARCRQKVVDREKSNGKLVYKKNQIFVTTTPEGFRGTYEIFKRSPAPDTKLVQMSTYSNRKNLPADYIDDLKSSYPPQLISAYLEGEFVNLNSLGVWASFDVEHNHMSTEIRPGETLHTGQDFNVGRGCAVTWVERILQPEHEKNPTSQPLKVFVAAHEVIDTFDTPDTIRALNDRFPKEKFDDRVLYPDNTGDNRKSVNATITDISIMKREGWRVVQRAHNPPIKDRITSANAAFCTADGVRRAFVDTEKCPVFTDSLVKQAYDRNGLPEKGATKGDDVTDAGTYPLEHHFPVRPNKMFVTSVGGL
jgi:hypothetical protein